MASNREELRKFYFENTESLTDKQILELALSTAVSNVDTKALADRLIKEFNNLANIYNASPRRLMKVEGVSEATAVYLSMFREIARRMALNKNKNITHIKSTQDAIPFFSNMLKEEVVERIALVSLDSNYKIISAKFISEGTMNFSGVSTVTLSRIINDDMPKYVFISHNHLNNDCNPSHDDQNFTININQWLKGFGVKLIDHIIICNDQAYSFKDERNYPIIND